MSRRSHLFIEFDLSEVMRRAELQMHSEIDGIDGDSLLNTSVEDLCDYLEKKYTIAPPGLIEEGVSVEDEETKINHTPATTLRFFVPFTGNAHLFRCRASTFLSTPPRADIRDGELVLTYTRVDHDALAARAEFDRDLGEIKSCLEWTERDVAPFNQSVTEKARQHIEARRNQLLKDRGMVAGLGFPLHQREGAAQTYVVPVERKKVTVFRPSPSSTPYVPEPLLEMAVYEEILGVITNMAAVMERSPKAFRGMGEEDLRQHFLVQLNGQYEGQATGETFNFEGKTDILIRAEGKNIFIAECKFWDGPESFKKALDQLLNYASWRDTKTALLIFNRDRNLTTVLGKIPEVVKAHVNFKRELEYKSETGLRFVLHHRDDKNRELILTVLVFEVPS